MNPLEKIIRNIIDNKVQNGEMFTAYDITLIARASGEYARHPQVKSIVHDLMRNGDLGLTYTSVLRAFGVSAFPAVVYFPLGADVSNYDPGAVKKALAQVPNATSTLAQPVVAVVTTTVANGASNVPTTVGATLQTAFPKIVNVGSGNRVRVPAESIRKLGLKSGDKAYVSVDGDEIAISLVVIAFVLIVGFILFSGVSMGYQTPIGRDLEFVSQENNGVWIKRHWRDTDSGECFYTLNEDARHAIYPEPCR